MNAFILKGTNPAKKEYLEKFMFENKIPSFSILIYSEDLKIAEAREIKKKISIPAHGGKRLVVIEGNPTLEAQNSLLKTIEELPEDTTIIFSGEEELLSTVISRCLVINLSGGKSQILSEGKLELEDKISSLLSLDRIFSQKGEKQFEEFIICVRSYLKKSIKEKNVQEIKRSVGILKELNRYSSLVAQNNLNPRIICEKSVLKSFFS